MHEILYRRERALGVRDLRGARARLDLARSTPTRRRGGARAPSAATFQAGSRSGEVIGTPTRSSTGTLDRDGYDASTLQSSLARHERT